MSLWFLCILENHWLLQFAIWKVNFISSAAVCLHNLLPPACTIHHLRDKNPTFEKRLSLSQRLAWNVHDDASSFSDDYCSSSHVPAVDAHVIVSISRSTRHQTHVDGCASRGANAGSDNTVVIVVTTIGLVKSPLISSYGIFIKKTVRSEGWSPLSVTSRGIQNVPYAFEPLGDWIP